MAVSELRPEEVRLRVAPESLGISSTDDLEDLEEKIMAQERAVRALDFGLNLDDLDFHLYVAGSGALGATYIARSLVELHARQRPRPWRCARLAHLRSWGCVDRDRSHFARGVRGPSRR